MLHACTNLESLSVAVYGLGPRANVLAPTFTPSLAIPSLRHIHLQVEFTDGLLEFMGRHCVSLRSIDVHWLSINKGERQIGIWNTIAQQHPKPLSPSCPVFCGSPVLAIAYVPESSVEDVCLAWYAEDTVLRRIAASLSFTLAKSSAPIKTISYLSSGWNLEFLVQAALNLPHLEALHLDADLGKFGRYEEPVSISLHVVVTSRTSSYFSYLTYLRSLQATSRK